MAMMRAVTFSDGAIKFRDDYPRPEPTSDEVLVRVTRAGICDTDLQIVAGYMSYRGVLGHEFVGVAEGGSLAGQRVVGEINCSCGQCDLCLGGLANHCPNRTVLGILGRDGAFADYLTLPERNLHAVPDELSDDEAVFVEPLAAAFQITRQVRLSERTRVLVLGDGKLGYLVAQVVKLQNAPVTVAGKYPEKLELLEHVGVGTVAVDELRRLPAFDVVVDATGSPSGIELALQVVRPRGTVVVKTTVAERTELKLADVVVNEITLVGSRCGPFPAAIEALKQRRIEVIPLIQDIYSLAHAEAAIAAAAKPGARKVLLAVDESVPAVKRVL